MMRLSAKQKEFINKPFHRWNFKIGATRSGKTWLDFNYQIPYMTRKLRGLEGLYVIMGVTQQTIERNVLQPMREIYGESLVGAIKPGTGTARLFGETYYCLGAEKVNAVAKIQGMAIKYCYGDEVPNWNREVFEMLKSRLDKEYSQFDGTGNPDHPNHYVKEFLDSGADIFYQRYTLYDNPFLAESFVKALEQEYAGTVYYDRFILGLWASAEGKIYRPFNRDVHVIKSKDWIGSKLKENILFVSIGVDFGGSKSATSFTASALTRSFQQIITVDEELIKKELTPQELDRRFIEFVKRVTDEYHVVSIRADSAEQVLINGLRKALLDNRIPLQVKNAIKKPVNDRIRFYIRMMNSGRYFILDKCQETIKAFENALWSDKTLDDERLDDGTTNIDSLDSQEYSTEEYHSQFMVLGG